MNNSKRLLNSYHTKYFLRCLNKLPSDYMSLEPQRILIAFFVISGLDVLKNLESLSDERKNDVINWIYKNQYINQEVSGFEGSTLLNHPDLKKYRYGNLGITYAALSTLVTLGDDLSKINKVAILESITQLENGCFISNLGGEYDMRFMYCATSTCYILDDWSHIDIDKAVSFILKSISYDFGIGQGPDLESHGGSTFCAIASLSLMDRLDVLTEKQIKCLTRWLLFRQDGSGFTGRPAKSMDSCYSFWVCATLKILNKFHLTNFKKNHKFLFDCQNLTTGGISKWPYRNFPDVMHSYLGLSGWSFLPADVRETDGLVLDLNEIEPRLNITKKAFEHLKYLHKKWRNDV